MTTLARRRAAAIAITLASWLAPRVASADLRGDAGRLADAWRARGASIDARASGFLEGGRARWLRLGEHARERPREGCVTIALLSARPIDFTAKLDDPRAPPSPATRLRLPLPAPAASDRPSPSRAGALAITRCNDDPLPSHLVVEMTSSRGAIEVLIARSAAPPAPIAEALLERAEGPIAPRGDTGGPIEPGPLAERIARAERKARDDGANAIARVAMRSSPLGAGSFVLRVGEGCHRVEVMAEVPSTYPHRATDVDAEAREEDTGRVLARDRADVPDARLDFCVGASTSIEVPYSGASGVTNVTLVDARWPIPANVPSHFGARARAGFAQAMLRRGARAQAKPPVFEAAGVAGITAIPIAVTPGACYVAAASMVRGDARAMRLSAKVGPRSIRDDVIERPEGAAIAFCAGADRRAVVNVEVRGNTPWWAFALFHAGATGMVAP